MELNDFAKQIKAAKDKAQGAADVVRQNRDREAQEAKATRSRVKDVARAIANEIVAPCMIRFCKELPLPKPTVTEQDDEILITCTGANATTAAFRVRPAVDLAKKDKCRCLCISKQSATQFQRQRLSDRSVGPSHH